MRQPRPLYYISCTTEYLPNPREDAKVTILPESYSYDYEDTADQAFASAYTSARTRIHAEITQVNTTPATYCVFDRASHTRYIFRVETTTDGIELYA